MHRGSTEFHLRTTCKRCVEPQLESELKRAAAGRVAAPEFWSPMAPGVRQNFHVLWRAGTAGGGGGGSVGSRGFVPDGQLLWELTRPYCGLSR